MPRYRPQDVKALFDEMSATYGPVNLLSSFGFAWRWRRECVAGLRRAGLSPTPDLAVADLMTGHGECWPHLRGALGADGKPSGKVVALDFSAGMCRAARAAVPRVAPLAVEVREEDVLASGLAGASLDAVVSTFGLKTLDDDGQGRLAREIARVMKPGGVCALVEISVPPFAPLRALYLLYLRVGIPLVGRALLGNPDNDRRLAEYTEAFGNARAFGRHLRAAGLHVADTSHFFGCATGVVGRKL